ncbi:phosphonate ABC transporter substrate-binding protein [Desulfovibrio piger]|uniref:phosphonate ABC transporter substrate-binding protein n=1 Tax=Desulfovibrio piger TaxID=901 RepID=UPI0039F596A1
MFFRLLSGLLVSAMLLGSALTAQAQQTLNFGIISTEASQNLKVLWEPFLRDMSKALGMEVKAFFASDYAGIIEGMRFKKVDLSWIGNKGAMVMVDRANGEVFAQTTAPDGSKGYYSCLIVNRKSPLQNLDDMFAQASRLSFSNGDPNSTSGFLVPGYYVFAKNGKDPQKIFARTVSANHEANALSVANNTVDVATCNNEGLARLAITAPEKAKELRVIWKSPLIPSDPLVWRKDLSDETKKKITDFIFSYGVKGENVEQARKILTDL